MTQPRHRLTAMVLAVMAAIGALHAQTPADTIASADTIIAAPARHKTERIGRKGQTRLPDSLLNKRVIVGRDTIPVIIPQRNYSRYDRGLFNHLFIPRGQWSLGLTASYGELNTDNVQLLNIMSGLDFNGKIYSVKPTVSYAFRSNETVGLSFTYTRGQADLNNMSVDFDEDLNFSLTDVSYYSQTYGVSVFYRYYVGLSEMKRFGVFNEIEAGVSSGAAHFNRLYGGEPRNTRTISTSASLNFSPGVTVFIMDQAAFNVSFGVFGLHWTHQSQTTNGADDGSRTTSGANFRFNLFNINFGVSVYI